jgi:hypothetical protein
MPEPVDRIEVVTSTGSVVEISSASREAVVQQLQRFKEHGEQYGEDMAWPTRRAFEAAGSSGPINLDRRAIAGVIDAINALAERAGGADHLGAGLAELQRMLMAEFLAD